MIATRLSAVALVVLLLPAVGAAPPPDGLRVIVCAPGYPGSTAEAQPAMDDFAAAVASAAKWRRDAVAATYFEREDGGVAALADAGLALVTLPFFLEHRAGAELRPRLLAVPEGREPLEPWTLVAGAGAVRSPADLDGWSIVSLAGHSPRFVRAALADWGTLPETVTVELSSAVLSSLRRAARGEPIALLLDAEQTAALERLPFADDLETVHTTRPLPVSLLCSVDDHVAETLVDTAVAALLSLGDAAAAADAMAGVRLDRFEVIEAGVVDGAIEIFNGTAE